MLVKVEPASSVVATRPAEFANIDENPRTSVSPRLSRSSSQADAYDMILETSKHRAARHVASPSLGTAGPSQATCRAPA